MPTSDPRLGFAPPKSEPRIWVYARIRAGSEARGLVVKGGGGEGGGGVLIPCLAVH